MARGGGDAPQRPGLPDPASVVGERELPSPKGERYKIIRTHERDAYDKPDEIRTISQFEGAKRGVK